MVSVDVKHHVYLLTYLIPCCWCHLRHNQKHAGQTCIIYGHLDPKDEKHSARPPLQARRQSTAWIKLQRVDGTEKVLLSQKPSSPQSSTVTTWMGDHYVLGFASTPRFLRVKFYAGYKSPSDETINKGPRCGHTYK